MTTRTLAELADLCGARLEGDGARRIDGPAALDRAGPGEISFLASPPSPRYRALFDTTRAGAVVVGEDLDTGRRDVALLRCPDPSGAFTRVLGAFVLPEPRPPAGVHPTAVVDPSAVLGAGVSIGAMAFVGARARLGDRVVLHPGAIVREDVAVGRDTELHPGVVLYPRVEVGAACTIHAGAVIGCDGFGYEPSAEGLVKVPQCGTVRIEDEVEIGANAAIDRARFGATRIGRGAKIDNLVQIGHNVEVGNGAILCAQVGVSGSAKIGAQAVLAGQVGVNGHIAIGERARVAGQAGVFGDLPGKADYFGFPARPRGEALRTLASLQRVSGLIEQVRALEERLARLDPEKKASSEERR